MAQSGNTITWWNPLSWFNSAASAASSWFAGMGGKIASGIEGGFVALFKDLADAVMGYVEIILAISIAILVLMIYFSGDIARAGLSVAGTVG